MIPDEIVKSLRDRLTDRAEDVCRYLLPKGMRKGNRWVCGDIYGNPGESLSVELEGNKAGLWKDYATDDGGDLLKLWQDCRGLDFPQAAEQAADFVNIMIPTERKTRRLPLDDYEYSEPPDPQTKPTVSLFVDDQPKPAEVSPFLDDGAPPAPRKKLRSIKEAEGREVAFDWGECVAALTPDRLAELADWRGFSPEFVEFLAGASLIGLVAGNWALPVHDASGQVVRAHYRIENGDWRYTNGSNVNTPLVIGDPSEAGTTLLFESQWDAFAVLDALHYHEDPRHCAAIITRGASSNLQLGPYLEKAATVIAVPQNDPPAKKNSRGRTPAEEWLFKICEALPANLDFRVATTPEIHKDVNDWIRAERPSPSEVSRQVIQSAKNRYLRNAMSIADLLAVDIEDDPNILIGPRSRFLGRGGSWLIVGPSGIGKSTLTTGIALHASVGIPWNGIEFRRPLKVLVMQAENDEGDLSEMIRGALEAAGLNQESLQLANENLHFVLDNSSIGAGFCEKLEEAIRASGAEVVLVDPLLSFVGDDIAQQKVASQFLRNWLQPILTRTGVIAVIIHHTGKTSTDSNSRKHWNDSDYAYLALGSSELTNWARAISVLVPIGKNTGVYKFLVAKRSKRAGMKNAFTNELTTSISLRHSTNGLGWVQCEPPMAPTPEPKDPKPKRNGFSVDLIVAYLEQHDGPVSKDAAASVLSVLHQVSKRTVRERINDALLAELIHVVAWERREGGGKDVAFLALGSRSENKERSENLHDRSDLLSEEG